MRAIVATGVALTAATYCGSAQAEPVTLACTILDSSHSGYRVVDQIVLDLERDTADFRVARTMGTSWPQNWLFKTRYNDTFDLSKQGSEVVGVGLIGGKPTTMRLTEDWQFSFAALADDSVWWYRWSCYP